MAHNLNRPPSGIGSAGNTAGACGEETQPDASNCEAKDTTCSAVDNLDEGSIRQDQLGYNGS